MLYLTDDIRLGEVKLVQMRVSGGMSWGKRGVVQVLEDPDFNDSLIVNWPESDAPCSFVFGYY